MGLFAILSSSQTNAVLESSRVEITLTASVASQGIFVRYVLGGQDLGGVVYGPPNVSSFGISKPPGRAGVSRVSCGGS